MRKIRGLGWWGVIDKNKRNLGEKIVNWEKLYKLVGIDKLGASVP